MDLRVLARKLEKSSDDLLVNASTKGPETFEKVATAIAAASTLLTSVADDMDKNASLQLTEQQLNEMAALASAFDESSDPLLKKQASVLDEILLSIAAPRNAGETFRKVQDEEIERLRTERRRARGEEAYVQPKKELHDMWNSVAQAKAVEQQVKRYVPMEAALQTRYPPDRPGGQMTRISDGVYQDIETGIIYDYKAGYTTQKGNKVPGGSVENQTRQLGDYRNNPTSVFQTRESVMGRYSSEEVIGVLKIARDKAPRLLSKAMDYAFEAGFSTTQVSEILADGASSSGWLKVTASYGPRPLTEEESLEECEVARKGMEELKEIGGQLGRNLIWDQVMLLASTGVHPKHIEDLLLSLGLGDFHRKFVGSHHFTPEGARQSELTQNQGETIHHQRQMDLPTKDYRVDLNTPNDVSTHTLPAPKFTLPPVSIRASSKSSLMALALSSIKELAPHLLAQAVDKAKEDGLLDSQIKSILASNPHHSLNSYSFDDVSQIKIAESLFPNLKALGWTDIIDAHMEVMATMGVSKDKLSKFASDPIKKNTFLRLKQLLKFAAPSGTVEEESPNTERGGFEPDSSMVGPELETVDIPEEAPIVTAPVVPAKEPVRSITQNAIQGELDKKRNLVLHTFLKNPDKKYKREALQNRYKIDDKDMQAILIDLVQKRVISGDERGLYQAIETPVETFVGKTEPEPTVNTKPRPKPEVEKSKSVITSAKDFVKAIVEARKTPKIQKLVDDYQEGLLTIDDGIDKLLQSLPQVKFKQKQEETKLIMKLITDTFELPNKGKDLVTPVENLDAWGNAFISAQEIVKLENMDEIREIQINQKNITGAKTKLLELIGEHMAEAGFAKPLDKDSSGKTYYEIYQNNNRKIVGIKPTEEKPVEVKPTEAEEVEKISPTNDLAKWSAAFEKAKQAFDKEKPLEGVKSGGRVKIIRDFFASKMGPEYVSPWDRDKSGDLYLDLYKRSETEALKAKEEKKGLKTPEDDLGGWFQSFDIAKTLIDVDKMTDEEAKKVIEDKMHADGFVGAFDKDDSGNFYLSSARSLKEGGYVEKKKEINPKELNPDAWAKKQENIKTYSPGEMSELGKGIDWGKAWDKYKKENAVVFSDDDIKNLQSRIGSVFEKKRGDLQTDFNKYHIPGNPLPMEFLKLPIKLQDMILPYLKSETTVATSADLRNIIIRYLNANPEVEKEGIEDYRSYLEAYAEKLQKEAISHRKIAETKMAQLKELETNPEAEYG